MVNLESHEKICKYKLFTCPNAPCSFKGTNLDLENHQGECNFAKISCRKCGADYVRVENHNCIVFLKNKLNNLATKINSTLPKVPIETLKKLIEQEKGKQNSANPDRKCTFGHPLTYYPVNHP